MSCQHGTLSIVSRADFYFLLKILATVLLLGLIIWQVPLGDLVAAFSDLRWWPVMLAIALTPPIQALKIAKWGFIVSQARPHVRFPTTAVSFLVGVAVGIVTPARTGELTRVLYLNTENRFELLGLVVADRVMDLATILLFAGVSVGLLTSPPLGLIPILGAALLAVGLAASRSLAEWIEATRHSFPGKSRVSRLLGQLRTLRPSVISKGMLLSVLIFALALLQFYWLLTAFEPVSWKAPVVSFPLLVLAGALPITIAGIGVREGTATLVLLALGVAEVTAIGAAVFSFTMNTLLPGLLGAVLLMLPAHPRLEQGEDATQENR